MHYNYRLIIASLCAVLMVSCGENLKPEEPDTPEKPEIPGIVLDESSRSVLVQTSIPSDAETAEPVKFTANDAWSTVISAGTKAGESVDWVKVSPDHGGAGTYTLSISLDKNTATEPRSATISIICGDATEKISITQVGAEPKPYGMVKKVRVEGSDWNTTASFGPDGTSYYFAPIELAFTYDSEDRISAFQVFTEEEDLDDPDEEMYEFEYKSNGLITIKATYDGHTNEMPMTVDASGHIIDIAGMYYHEYNESGYLAKWGEDDDDYICYLYKDGALVGASWNDDDIVGKIERASKYLDTVYPNRYPVSKANIDLNLVILGLQEQAPYYGIFTQGSYMGGYLMEAPLFSIIEDFDDDEPSVSGVSDAAPGTVTKVEIDWNGDGRIDSDDDIVRTVSSPNPSLGKWTFNDSSWPTGFSCEICEDKCLITYYETVTDRVSDDTMAILNYIKKHYPDENPEDYMKTHTFYEVERSTVKEVIEKNVSIRPYSISVEYY